MKSSHRVLLVAFASTALAAFAADGAATWTDQCAKCHGADGKGETKMGKKLGISDLSDAAVQAKFKDDEIIKFVKEGIKDKEGKLAMKPIEGVSDDDIKALVPVVRGFKK